MLPETLDPDALRTIALVVLGVLVVAAVLVLRMIRKMVLRVVLLGLLAGLGVYVWYERDTLRDCVPNCACTVAGFDVHVAGCPPPDS